MTAPEAAAVLGITSTGVRDLAARGRLPGARHIGMLWWVPARTVVARLLDQLSGKQS
jgi:excisionase family DNA binding protein